MVLKKDDILNGVKDPQLIKIEALDGELPLRPLSKKEWNDIEKIEAKAYGKFEANETAQKGRRQIKQSEMKTKGIIDLEKQSKAEFEGKSQAIFLSINNTHNDADKWKKEEVQGLSPDSFDEIFKAVQKLSGIKLEDEDEDEEKEMDDFPGNK